MNMHVDKNARAFASSEILINASTEKVYMVLSDIKKWPLWQTAINSTNIEGLPEEGKIFLWNTGGMKIKSRLHTVIPFSQFGWTGKMWWISAIHNWEFIQTAVGTKVKVSESMSGFASALLKKMLEEGLKKSLIELKKEVEK